MNRNQELFEKIEAYLEQDMDPQELAAFRQALEENPDLQKEVTKHQELEEALTDEDVQAFKKKLKKILKQRSTPKISYYWYAAASLVVVLGVVLYFQPWRSSTQELYDLYYKPYPGPQINRGQNDTIPLEEALDRYQKGQYEEAIPELKQSITGTPDNHELYLYLGNCYLQIGDTQLALESLMGIPPESPYETDALWFMTMSYLSMDDIAKAKAELEQLVETDNIHRGNARKILREIE